MSSSQLNKSRFIMGIILIVLAALTFVFARGSYSAVGTIVLALLGLINIAISRRK